MNYISVKLLKIKKEYYEPPYGHKCNKSDEIGKFLDKTNKAHSRRNR